MRKTILLFQIAVLIFIAGCGANVRTYTFETERPDQQLQGNRGYVMGEAPSPPTSQEQKKRTIAGVDIELPTLKEAIEETGLQFHRKK